MSNSTRALSLCIAATLLAACGGGSDSSGGSAVSTTTSTPTQTANLAVMVSDASSEDWATIGVKIMSIALVPQGGGQWSESIVYSFGSQPGIADGSDPVAGLMRAPDGNFYGTAAEGGDSSCNCGVVFQFTP